MTKFIILAGQKQVGKDTSAGMIYDILSSSMKRTEQIVDGMRLHPIEEYQIHITHFADALKDACAVIFGINRLDMETEEGKNKLTDVRQPRQVTFYDTYGDPHPIWVPDPNGKFMTVRQVLQYVGTDLFRAQVDPDVWIKSIFRRKYAEKDVVIIADCRFPNEASFAKQNGLVIKIERDRGVHMGDVHKSERALDDYQEFDAVIDNNSSLDALRNRLLSILQEHKFI